MNNQPINIWYGDSDRNPFGPIKGIMLEYNPIGESKIEITDPQWLDDMGINYSERYFYRCGQLPPDRFVGRDDYAWSKTEE